MTPSKRRNTRNSSIMAAILAVVVLFILVLTRQINLEKAITLLAGEEAPVSQTVELVLPDLLASSTPAVQGDAATVDATITLTPGQDFDYFVLALSWSPDYCATEGDDDTQQCSLGKKLGFVLHGLWPQFEKGYPSNCPAEEFPAALKNNYPNLYPNDQLYSHEWEKHGACSGLSPEAYLALSKALKEAVHIPAAYKSPEKSLRATSQDVQSEFVEANPDLVKDGVAVYCSGDGRFLTAVYICFSLDGQFRSCSQEILQRAGRSCGSPNFLIRNVR